MRAEMSEVDSKSSCSGDGLDLSCESVGARAAVSGVSSGAASCAPYILK